MKDALLLCSMLGCLGLTLTYAATSKSGAVVCPVPPEYRVLAVNGLIGSAVLAWYAGAVVWVRNNGWGDAWDKREDPAATTVIRLLQVVFSPILAPLWWFGLAARRLVLPKEKP